jgi:hypothetical protein
LRSVRPRHDDPDIPDDVQARDLDKVARNELKTLSKDNADWVAKHLVMAGRLIDDDPELAHQHALSAARRAGRIAVVRESLAITAYETGDYALALRELRTYRRISGSDEQLPLMVDSERGVGRPEKALELGRSVDRSTLTPATQVSLAIAMSGARLDLGSPELALGELEIPQLDPDRAFTYSPALYDAYAEVLTELGRQQEAAVWRKRASVALEMLGGEPDEDETIIVVEEEGPVEEPRAQHADPLSSDAFDDAGDAADGEAQSGIVDAEREDGIGQEQDGTEPDVTEQDETEHDVAESDATESDVTEPYETEADETEPDQPEPDQAEQEQADPEMSNPEGLESGPSEPSSKDESLDEVDAGGDEDGAVRS